MKILKNKYYKLASIFIFCCFFIQGCSKERKITFEETPKLEVLYKEALNEFENGNWQRSVELFKKVELHYSFSKWAPRATLMIMFIYYEASEYTEAIQYAVKYKKLYPVSKNLDYVDYIIGMIFYEQISVPSRDNKYAHEALKQFKKIQKEYPNSIYANDIKLKIDLVNEQLAGKEMYIARFYMDKSNWIPALKRLNNILDNYSSTVYVDETLHRFVEIYYKLGNLKKAKFYAAMLGYNFNDSDWYKKSYKLIEDKNYTSEIKKDKIKLKNRVKKIFSFSNDK